MRAQVGIKTSFRIYDTADMHCYIKNIGTESFPKFSVRNGLKINALSRQMCQI